MTIERNLVFYKELKRENHHLNGGIDKLRPDEEGIETHMGWHG